MQHELERNLRSFSEEIGQSLLKQEIAAADQLAPQFHGEFLQYALEDEWMGFPLKDSQVTNWRLLRYLISIRHGKSYFASLVDAKKTISFRQRKNGLIEDNAHVRSFQYHCFSLALIYELWLETEDSAFLKSFQKGIDFIKIFISLDGSALYVGRGQEQLFGYASLIYILCLANEWVLLKRVMAHVEAFRCKKGRFPLVLRKGEAASPDDPDLKDEGFLGWYGYNNYFDYLAFAGVFLVHPENEYPDLGKKKK